MKTGSFIFGLLVLLTVSVQAAPRPRLDGSLLMFRDAQYDPVRARLTEANVATNLYVVQFKVTPTDAFRAEIRKLGGQVLKFIPTQAHLVKILSPSQAELIKQLPYVRFVGKLRPELKMEKAVRAALVQDERAARPYAFVVTQDTDRPILVKQLQALGARVLAPTSKSILVDAIMNAAQVQKAIQLDEVLWVEKRTPAEYDMWTARIQGGADAIESETAPPGYTGRGVRGHVMEGVYATHPDLQGNDFRKGPIAIADPAPDGHGMNTYGQIFGDGKGNAKARGLIPNAQGFYTNASKYSGGAASRYDLVMSLVKDHGVMFQTASWGHARTLDYTAVSAEMDRIIFDADIPITQSQSNAGSQQSRPQAWAKNVISVGALYHFGTADASDDKWNRGASIGPAKDGRIKPELSAHYDLILTTDGPTGYTNNFGGTSGATPIVAGHLGLSLQMWMNGIFGNPTRERSGVLRLPHAMTTKALLINSANQYPFQGLADDRKRTHQGWGFPSVKNLFDRRMNMLIVDQSDPVAHLGSRRYSVVVANGEPELKVTMSYRDREANPALAITRINNLDLKVTAPNGTVFWGNNGLLENNYSVPGGQPNQLDTVENVFVDKPVTGTWTIEVLGTEVVDDIIKTTPETDADFALVASGIRRGSALRRR